MSLFLDMYQHGQTRYAHLDAAEAKSAASRLQTEMADLRRKTETLSLTCQALWEIMREQGKWDDEKILQRILEIDLRDGKVDGKIAVHPVAYPKCSRQNSSRHDKCLYCGTKLPTKHVFGKG